MSAIIINIIKRMMPLKMIPPIASLFVDLPHKRNLEASPPSFTRATTSEPDEKVR